MCLGTFPHIYLLSLRFQSSVLLNNLLFHVTVPIACSQVAPVEALPSPPLSGAVCVTFVDPLFWFPITLASLVLLAIRIT